MFGKWKKVEALAFWLGSCHRVIWLKMISRWFLSSTLWP